MSSTNKTYLDHYNYLVIGGGSGGVASSRRAASYGAKVLLIEASKMGGTCVNAGCVPKKVMWYASDLAEKIKQLQGYCFNAENVSDATFNYSAFKPKKDAYIQRLNQIYERNLAKEKVDFIYGYATFDKGGKVVVKTHTDSKTFTADRILIATGGSPVHPPDIPGAELGIDSDGFFKLEKLPSKVVIVGAGYIAVELAGVLHNLGSEVELIIRGSTVLRKFDESIQNTITDYYIKKGINIHKNSQVKSIEKNVESGSLSVSLDNGKVLEVDGLIWSIGRRSLSGIGLDNVGVELNDLGQVKADEYQQTTAKNIYSLGDVVGKVELTPVAIATGRKLANRLFGPEKFKNQKQDFENVPSVVFSHPEAGSIGLTEKEAIEKYGQQNIKIYKSRFTSMYYAMLEEKSPTSYKLICAGENEKVVGLHIVGDSSAEILQGFGVAIKMGATKADFDSCVAIHPTSAEELVTLV
ncbi:glutathione-disulfide reductase GLR1 [Ascoidea rubescens DSM 1968]|uniref:Glutathione reductase n=1 Tax=Ascoidea rubescens DSM 1968 TaxID=1344418 RepID=A0A1D2VNH7_9ASCO|nr:putative glutathione oxidoreductase [Ascoidea rubescens DSM 1968]ODV63160.1 putative glutathione oxidoreductase [Ascoidea rubescens DSM 1968]